MGGALGIRPSREASADTVTRPTIRGHSWATPPLLFVAASPLRALRALRVENPTKAGFGRLLHLEAMSGRQSVAQKLLEETLIFANRR